MPRRNTENVGNSSPHKCYDHTEPWPPFAALLLLPPACGAAGLALAANGISIFGSTWGKVPEERDINFYNGAAQLRLG